MNHATNKTTGIGAAIAENLASKGASLVLNYTSDSSLETTNQLSDHLTAAYDVRCLVVQADMGTPTGPAHLVASTKNSITHPKTGKFVVDILINNAGVAKDQFIPDVTVEEFERQYKINVLGPLLLMQATLPYLPHDRSGRIVNLSSVSSSEGFKGQSIYGGTKAALEAMTRTWSRELAERATVNAINPGPVLTDMWSKTSPDFKEHLRSFVEHSPSMAIRKDIDAEALVMDGKKAGGRPGYVEEIAGIVGMLCTQDSMWCTGQVVCANGGMRMAI